MVFLLSAFDGSGTDLGTIFIHVNPPGGGFPEGHGWEWQGNGINTGGTFQWSHNGHGFVLELFESGGRFGSLFNAWEMPPNSSGEPPRPWFASPGRAAGIGSVAPGTPARLTAAFNWRLR